MAGNEAVPLEVGEGAPARQVRKSPSARRAEVIGAARAVLTAATGPDEVGLADIADAAGVSKALLYRYFPGGRIELVDTVRAQLVDELLAQLRDAAGMPFSVPVRLDHVLAAVFTFFDREPGAFHLVAGPGASGPDGPGLAAHAGLVSTISAVVADADRRPDDLLALATGLAGFVLATVERCLDGALDAERAWQLSCRCARMLTES